MTFEWFFNGNRVQHKLLILGLLVAILLSGCGSLAPKKDDTITPNAPNLDFTEDTTAPLQSRLSPWRRPSR